MAKAKRAAVEQSESYVEWAADLSDQFLLCRDLGHQWKPWRAAATKTGFDRVLRCTRCKTERRQELNGRGHVMTGSYEYAEGYLAPRGLGRLDADARDGLRLESLIRLVEKSEGR